MTLALAGATAGMYRKTSVSLSTEGQNYYANKPLQTLTYTMFKAPITINEGSNLGSIRYSYNSHLSRTKMLYGWAVGGGSQVLREVAPTYGFTKTKFYTDDGSSEIIKANGKTTIITYIGGTAYSAPLYNEKVKTTATGAVTENKYYLHRDYLGSIIAISNAAGVAIERRHFDARGNLVKLQQNGVLTPLPLGGDGGGLMVLDRGYTSHEHLAEVSLINMNGRLYDPKLRTFLMPDNFVQQPENTQNYNRYAYVLNNPLKYTDPSGEFIPFLAFVPLIVAAFTYTATCFFGGQNFSWGGLAQTVFVAALSSAVTMGIGAATSSMFTTIQSTTGQLLAKAATQSLLHGVFNGTVTGIQGGNFWTGFNAGALSSVASSVVGRYGGEFARSAVGHALFGAVSGGVGARLADGNFWQGAAIGATVALLNHYAHQQQVKSAIEKNFPGLLKSMSKIKSYLKSNDGVMKSFTENSGYSKAKALKIFSLSNLIKTVKVTNLSDYGEFRKNDSKHVYIDKYLATSLDTGGFMRYGGNRTSLIGTDFLAGVTIMHEFVHQGRFINGLSSLINGYEAGQYFETEAFGQVNYSATVDSYVKKSGW